MGTPHPTPIATLLVVADTGARSLLESVLLERGHDVSVAQYGKRAAKALESHDFQLVIVGWPGPKSAALDLTQRLRRGHRYELTTVVAVVTADQAGDIVQAIESGVDDFVVVAGDRDAVGLRFRTIESRVRERSVARETQHALRESEARYSLTALGANDGLWDWDLQADSVYFSPRWKAMLGWQDHEIGNDPEEWFKRIHPDDVKAVRAGLDDHLAGGTPAFESEHRMQHRDGSYRWVLCRGIALGRRDGQRRRMAGSQTDITGRKRTEEQLHYDALHDTLTGLPNRALFMDRLGQVLGKAKRNEESQFAVLLLDVDRFKLVNDSMGHTAGDQLLVGIARRLETSLRPGDTVARLGGDEFGILLDGIHEGKEATIVAERVLKELKSSFELAGQEVFANASIGIALSANLERPEDYLRDADTAMYRAKELGRNRYAMFDRIMHQHAVKTLRLENDLRRAIERQEFCVYYQPIVSLENGKVAGFEALVRWLHPERGLVLPGDFIGLAEETGLIVPIDRWVATEACRQIRAWQVQFKRNPPLTVAVNISGIQFMQPDLIMQIDHILRKFGLYGDQLKLEITESVIMENAKYASAMLEHLRALNIKLSIDDFGTGYSSLSYLRRFEIDTLKIDASFVSKMAADEESEEIVRTIVQLARNLGKDMIAEGVETASQLARLRDLRCKYAQGHFFSKPLDAEAATRLIALDPKW